MHRPASTSRPEHDALIVIPGSLAYPAAFGGMNMLYLHRFICGVCAILVPFGAAFACSSGSLEEETSSLLGTERSTLGQACNTSGSCGTNEACCGEKCRLIVDPSGTYPRLAAMSNGSLEYACYANQPSTSFPQPSPRH